VTRGDIEELRGVSVSSSIIQTLLEREWIKVIGQKPVPGRPSLYGTTKQFLDYFNLSTLSELPTLEAVQSLNEFIDNHPTAQANRENPQTTA
jgi:segregation and condensation protein B